MMYKCNVFSGEKMVISNIAPTFILGIELLSLGKYLDENPWTQLVILNMSWKNKVEQRERTKLLYLSFKRELLIRD